MNLINLLDIQSKKMAAETWCRSHPRFVWRVALRRALAAPQSVQEAFRAFWLARCEGCRAAERTCSATEPPTMNESPWNFRQTILGQGLRKFPGALLQ
jgi:hypothetical protein